MFAKRPLMWASLSFVAGIYILSFLNFTDVLLLWIFLVLLCIVLLLKKKKQTICLVFCVIMFLAGSIRYDIASDIKRRGLYPFINSTVDIEAEITEEIKITENSISFFANVTSVTDKGVTHTTNEKVRFSKYIEKEEDIHNFMKLSLGDVISLKGKIKTPNAAMNSGGFSYQDYLKTEGVFFQCNIDSTDIEITDHVNRPFLHSWVNFRRKCIGFFDETFPENEGDVLKAFITGDSSDVSDEIEETFSKSGLSHVLAVSGLHVSVFISLIVSLLKLFKISKRKEMFLSAAAALFFVFFTGASVSALRAGMLAVFALVAKLLYRKADSPTTLSLAACALALINPLSVYSASFLLSFAATAGILAFYKTISNFFQKAYRKIETKSFLYKVFRNISDSFAVGISAQIFVTPLLVYMFNGFSVMSVVSTMLVIPFLSYMLAGGILFIAVSFISSTIATPFAGFIYMLSKLLLFISDYFGRFSFSKILFGEISAFLLLVYGLFFTVIVSALKKHKSLYITAIVSLTILTSVGLFNEISHYNTAQISFINVGQGDCTLFKAPGDCDILFDSGGYENSEGTGEFIIAPYLIKNGVNDIEYVFISHMDKDHTIGLMGLLDEMKIENIIIPYGQSDTENKNDILKKASESNVNVIYFTAGDKLKVNDDIEIYTLLPDKDVFKYVKGDNDSGMVLKLSYGENSFLFTGDISSDIEKHLLRAYPDKLDADVLKVAHHGSKYSTNKEFIDAVNPRFSYIPVGRNTYGHPTPEVIERLNNAKVQIYRADIHKDVTFYFDKERIKGVKYHK